MGPRCSPADLTAVSDKELLIITGDCIAIRKTAITVIFLNTTKQSDISAVIKRTIYSIVKNIKIAQLKKKKKKESHLTSENMPSGRE